MSDLRHIAEILDDPRRRAELFNAFPTLVWCADGRGGCTLRDQALGGYTGGDSPQGGGGARPATGDGAGRGGPPRFWGGGGGVGGAVGLRYRGRRPGGAGRL